MGLGSLVPVFPFLCPPARGFWPGTSWEPPGSMPQPCFLPLPVITMPGNDSMSPEEQFLKLSRCYHPSSCRRLLCSQSQTLWLSQPGKANSCLGCLFHNRFSFASLVERSHSCASCSCILCTSFFIPGKVLLGGSWGQALVPVAASATLRAQGDVLGLIPYTRASLFSAEHTSLQGNMPDFKCHWHVPTPKLISGLPTTVQIIKIEAQNMF